MPSSRKAKPQKNDPVFISGQQAGWSESAGRYLSKEGKFISRQRVIELNSTVEKDTFGGSVKYKFPTPISTNFGILELNMFDGSRDVPMSGFGSMLASLVKKVDGYEENMQKRVKGAEEKFQKDPSGWEKRNNTLKAVQGFDKAPEGKPMPNYMPSHILTRYELAEHYYETDGDVSNVVDVPVEMLSRKINVVCADAPLQKAVEEFIAEHEMEAMVSELWSVNRTYGQAFPLEIWDNPENPKDYVATIPLPPKSVHIGYNWAYGLGTYGYLGHEMSWTESMLESVFPPAMFRVLRRHWNDSPMYDTTGGVMLSGNFLRPIFDKRRSWMRYSMPMISRGFRELVDRQVYEDSVRALVEGYKYQLWVFKLGDKDHMPLPQVTSALMDVLNGQAGDRTGQFVFWDAPLTVEVHVPKGLQEMISNDYHGGLTKQFLRKMGITSQVIDGETPGTLGSSGGRGAAADKGDTNVQLYLERARYQGKQVLDWLTYVVRKWVGYNATGMKLSKKAASSLSLEFAPTYVEMAGRIKEIFGPMYRDGALSHATYVSEAGLKGNVEISRKKTEKKDQDILLPPVSYVQAIMKGDGSMAVSGQTAPQGSPDAAGEQNNDLERKTNIISNERGIGFEAMHGHQRSDVPSDEEEIEDEE